MLKSSRLPNEKRSVDGRRRGFLAVAGGSFFGLGMAALAATGAVWTALVGRFMMPNVVAEPPNRFPVGRVEDYPPGHVETRYKEKFGVWIVREPYRGRSRIVALRTACTHLGCITIWYDTERVFKCPCHGSGFHADGTNFEGPAPRPLDRCAIRLAEDGQLEVDASRVFLQGQWNDPACFVNV